MAYDSKAIYHFCIYGILAVKMSNGRGDLPHPPEYNVSKFKKKLNLPHFFISHEDSIFIIIFNIILIVGLLCFTFVTNQRKNIPPEMTIQECVYYTIFSVHSMLQYIVSVTYTKFLYMYMTKALKSINEMQQTTSMRLTIILHDIPVIYVTYIQMYHYLMQ